MSQRSRRKAKVSYFYRRDIGSYYYGPGHPMKPNRLRLTHSLLLTYGMYRKMEVLKPHIATAEEIVKFHAPDYVEFLRRVSPDTEAEFEKQMQRYNVGSQTDCPIFDGLYEFMSSCAGASIDAAMKINHQQSDVCINWSGGLHHAKKAEASGFCYLNDIVLCILELLKYHARVLYIDIDIHHGDGVEEAFYTTDRVMTASFHKFGDFFPGSGDFRDIGAKEGKHCSVNFPLKEGLTDEGFRMIFRPIIDKIMEVYKPEAVVMCCGADSIAGDRLGCWNLTLEGHGGAIRYVRGFGLPVVVLGGGGYTPRNVARCWAYETAVCLGEETNLGEKIPDNEFMSYFGPDYNLNVATDDDLENRNTRPYLEKFTQICLQNLSALGGAPSVAFQDVPADFADIGEQARVAADTFDPDARADAPPERRAHDAEFFASDKDQDHGDVDMTASATVPM